MKTTFSTWNRTEVALVLIDYQPDQFAGVTSGNNKLIEINTRFLAQIASAYNIPIVLSTVAVKAGFNKPTVASLTADLPGILAIDRSSMNSWQDEAFRNAIAATGKTKLVMAGLWTEICLTFPVIDALAAGYEVMIITDAVGGTTQEAHQMAIQRMIQASAIPNTSFAWGAEMCPDWADPLSQHLRTIGSWYFPALAALKSAQ